MINKAGSLVQCELTSLIAWLLYIIVAVIVILFVLDLYVTVMWRYYDRVGRKK